MMQADVIVQISSQLSGKKIAVDLTPRLPGGENGGAKLMTLELVHALVKLLPETSFVLLTAEASHAELDQLEKEHANLQRLCVLHNEPQIGSPPLTHSLTWKEKVLYRLKSLAGSILPLKIQPHIKTLLSSLFLLWKKTVSLIRAVFPRLLKQHIKRLSRSVGSSARLESLIHKMGVDLLFCPFTAPFYADPRIPTVSVIYDLQYRAYPQFFMHEEWIERENNFRTAYQKANYLIAISEFVRQTVIETANLSPDRVIAVPIGLLRTPAQRENEHAGNELFESHSLQRGEYILYPANFWKHKNHAMLLTAFNLYRGAKPDSPLKLLCTGAPGARAEAFCDAVRRMGLADWVVYPGYVTPDEYDRLLSSAFAVIFPSLYEGFGIPVLEAMVAGVPVLCSKVTSLPEVGGEAVLYFDPRRPGQIVDALARLSEEPGLRQSLITMGLQRTLLFEGADRMAVEYASVFAKASSPRERQAGYKELTVPTE